MDSVKYFDDIKFMWDGGEYGQQEALAKRAEYEKEGFSVQSIAEGCKSYLFTRRVVKDVVVAAS